MSGYIGGTAQIPQTNAINDKSHPNLTTNIHNVSGYARGAAQIPQVKAINDKSCPNLTTRASTILQVTPEALPKLHRQTVLMTSLVPIRPRISTIVQQVTQDAQANTFNDKFHPNLTTNINNSSDYAGGTQTPQTNTINDMVWCKQMWGKTVKHNILRVLLNV